MADAKELMLADRAYMTVCEAVERFEIKYDKNEEKRAVFFSFTFDDLPVDFSVMVDADRQLVRFFSKLPVTFSEDKRVEGSIATNYINFKLSLGSFDYGIDNGAIYFRHVTTYRDSVLGASTICDMIRNVNTVVDDYNDKLFAVSKGYMSVWDFIQQCEEEEKKEREQ